MSSALPDPNQQADLADRIRLGDPEAEAALVAMFHDRVRLVALARTRDRELALDVAQETMAAVLVALREGRLRELEKLAAFVYATARNQITDQFRARARRSLEEPLSVEPPATAVADPLESAERMALVRGALGELSPLDRQILLMTLVDGLKPGAIGRHLNLSDKVVRARKSRAVKKVKYFLDRPSRS